MKRKPLRPRSKLRARKQLQRRVPLQRTPAMAATGAQRAAVAGRNCMVCGADGRVDPAHLVPKSLGGCGHALCVTALCRRCHRAYDRGELDLLPYLEPAWRPQLAHAVGHVGLVGALRRISGSRSDGM
jgi:5-methylcytosine-specific restriction endonuclease McrA